MESIMHQPVNEHLVKKAMTGGRPEGRPEICVGRNDAESQVMVQFYQIQTY